jgi:hypothetical protein
MVKDLIMNPQPGQKVHFFEDMDQKVDKLNFHKSNLRLVTDGQVAEPLSFIQDTSPILKSQNEQGLLILKATTRVNNRIKHKNFLYKTNVDRFHELSEFTRLKHAKVWQHDPVAYESNFLHIEDYVKRRYSQLFPAV